MPLSVPFSVFILVAFISKQCNTKSKRGRLINIVFNLQLPSFSEDHSLHSLIIISIEMSAFHDYTL